MTPPRAFRAAFIIATLAFALGFTLVTWLFF